MKNRFSNKSTNGFVIITNLEGEIKKVVYDNIDLKGLKVGKVFPAIVEQNNFNKAIEFIKNLNEKDAIFSWDINLKIRDKINTFNFSGVNNGDELMIIAGSGINNIFKYYEKILKINNEHVNKFRTIIKNNIAEEKEVEKYEKKEDDYEKLTKLNNELSNVQRKLMKKNKKIEDEREKFRVTLESIADGVVTTDKDGKINYINPVAERILKVTEANVINENFFEVVSLADPITKKSLEKSFKDEIKAAEFLDEDEVILKRDEDDEIPIAFKSSPIIDNSKQVLGSVIVFRDIIKQKEKQKKLKEYASTDKMTGAFNRRMGLIYLNKEIEYAKNNNTSLSVCFIDVNNLKDINDNLGHKKGDELLVKLTEVIKDNIRESDAVARFGGDEFLLIFPELNRDGAEKVWQRIELELKRIDKEKEFEISVSHGIVECANGCDSTAENLISLADERMYKEKKNKKSGEIRDEKGLPELSEKE